MELNYKDYIQQVENILNEETIRKIASKVETLGKFQRSSSGQWEPISYSGYTLITPTFTDDSENTGCYKELEDIRKEMLREKDFPQIVAAPSSAFHMTVARLISGEIFARKLMNSRENELLLALNQLFSQINISVPLKYEIKGLSIFPQGIIAAIVSPVTEVDYQYLQAFRDHIYSDKVLANLGVERKRSFCGHITLFYIEEDLSGHNRSIFAEVLANMNKRFFKSPLPYKITRAEVRKFDNFLSFYRQDIWPVYKFL